MIWASVVRLLKVVYGRLLVITVGIGGLKLVKIALKRLKVRGEKVRGENEVILLR